MSALFKSGLQRSFNVLEIAKILNFAIFSAARDLVEANIKLT